jgi:hypothetical protein
MDRMSLPFRVAVVIAAWAAAGVSALRAVEFTAYLRVDSGYRFVISDGQPLKTSDWLKLGQSFQDDQIVGFDEKTETLSVKTPGGTRQLPLKDAHVQAQATPLQPVELRLQVTPNGEVEFGNVAISLSAIQSFFRTAAAKGTPVALKFEQPDAMTAEKSDRAVKAMAEVLRWARASGVTKMSIETNAPRRPEDKPMANPVAPEARR